MNFFFQFSKKYICINLNWFAWPVLIHVKIWGKFPIWFSHVMVPINSHYENWVENWVKNWIGIRKPPNVGKNNPYLCVKHVLTNVGQLSFFCENQLISIITWCYENLINCLTYIIVWANENWPRYKVLNFSKLTQFLDGAILTCTIIINFHI